MPKLVRAPNKGCVVLLFDLIGNPFSKDLSQKYRGEIGIIFAFHEFECFAKLTLIVGSTGPFILKC